MKPLVIKIRVLLSFIAFRKLLLVLLHSGTFLYLTGREIPHGHLFIYYVLTLNIICIINTVHILVCHGNLSYKIIKIPQHRAYVPFILDLLLPGSKPAMQQASMQLSEFVEFQSVFKTDSIESSENAHLLSVIWYHS